MQEERIHNQDVARFIEGAHHAPDERIGEIHGCCEGGVKAVASSDRFERKASGRASQTAGQTGMLRRCGPKLAVSSWFGRLDARFGEE